MNTRALIIASVVSGSAVGLLTNVPNVSVISCVNCACCGWVWGFTILSTWLYKQFSDDTVAMTARQGALVGIATGLVGTLVYALAGVLVVPALLGGLNSWQSPRDFLYLVPVGLVFLTIGALGGLIGGALVRDRAMVANW